MGFNRSVGYLGLKRQSARGSAATAAAFKFPVYSGGILPTVEHSSERLSRASRNQGDFDRTGVVVPVEFETRLYVGSAVALLHAAMGGISTAGAADPYTHTLSTDALPYYTFMDSIGAADAVRRGAQDVKCNELDITWNGPAALRAAFKGLGTTCDMTQADFDGTAIDETDGDGYFFSVGGTFTWDAVGSTAAAFVCNSGGIRFGNNLSPVTHAAQITPYDHDEGQIDVVFTLEVVPQNALLDWIEVLTGSTTGSEPSGDTQYGKLALVFQEAGTGTHTLTVTASKVKWDIQPVGIDAENGQTVYSVEGVAVYNATESDAVDVSVTNANATAVYAAA